MLITNTTSTEERPRTLKGLKITSTVSEGEIEGITSEVVEGETAESGGRLKLLCVPYETPGPYWDGSLVYKKGCFSSWLASDGNATIRASAHNDNPRYNLASRSVGDAPGGVIFSEDERGLWANVNLLADDEVSKNVITRVRAGVIEKCSIGTIANKVEEDFENDITSVLECTVLETSLVSTGTERYVGAVAKESTDEAAKSDVIAELEADKGLQHASIEAKLDAMAEQITVLTSTVDELKPKEEDKWFLSKLANKTTTTATGE